MLPMMTLLLTWALVLQPGDARITLLSGPPRAGQVVALDDATLTLSESGQLAEVPVGDILSIELPSVTAPGTESQQLVLSDGSRLSVSSLVRTAQQVTAASGWLGAIEIPSSQVRSMRLQPENPALAAAWQEFQQRKTGKDLLVVAKRDGSGLDFLSGVVSSVSAEQIQFLLDGDAVPVPAARVYGIVFGQPENASATGSPGAKLLSGQDRVSMQDVSVAGARVSGTTGWGQSVDVALEQVSGIDLSGTRIRYLSELSPVEERFQGIDSENNLLAGLISPDQQQALFGPRRDVSLERQSKLRLRGQEYDRGLCVHSRTQITWNLAGGYTSLQAVIGIDDEVAYNGQHAVLLKIRGDDRVLFEELVGTSDPPRLISIPLDGVSTLSLLVDFGDGDSVCDWLDLADAKLIIAKEPR
jgi:hypothetical protein